ncbi:3-oxoacyl-ACP synthase III family protein [Bacteroidota bacterium]
MNEDIYSVIIGTGSYIPEIVVKNDNFLKSIFYEQDGRKIEKPPEEITEKFEEITGIKERRYVTDELLTSDISYLAGKEAIESADIDKESLDYIICAHNFGDVRPDNKRSDFVPSIAARVKNKLKIINPKTIAYDLPFGCPGWLQGMIHADCFIKTGIARRALIIGGEILSRISDPHDRDSMIYSDGAGATIIEGQETGGEAGILSHATRSDTLTHSNMLNMNISSNPDYVGNELFLKMHGHKLYKYALNTVPGLVKESIEKAKLSIENIAKVLLHQANEKMDVEILKRLFELYGIKDIMADFIKRVLPMSISWLGNSSVATIPTLLDLITKDKITGHSFGKSDIVVFASVGAGMNINSMVYKFP